MKKITHLILISILYSCSPNVNTTIPDKNKTPEIKTPDKNPISSTKPSDSPTPIQNPTNEPIKKVEVLEIKDIFIFPEYMVLEIGKERELFIKIKNSEGKYIDDFNIIISNPSIISIKDNKIIKGVNEGITEITVTPKNDISKSKSIIVQVKNNNLYDKVNNLNELTTPFVYNNDFNNNFILDYSEQFNNDKLYNINNNSGYPILNKIEENKKSKYSFIPRISENTNEKSYDLVVDIFHDNVMKKTVKINDFSYNDLLKISPINKTKISSNGTVFKYDLIKDINNNFYIAYTNQNNETRLKIFDKNGNQISKTVIISESNDYFNLNISSKGEYIVFSQKYSNYYSTLKVKIFNRDIKKISEKEFRSNSTNISNISISQEASNGIANISDLGDLVIAWKKEETSSSTNKKYIHIEKFNINNGEYSNYDYLTYINNDYIILNGLFINNDSDINLFWNYSYNNKSLFTRYMPSDKHKDFTYLKVNQHYKLDTKYNKCVSSNDNVVTIKPQDSLFYSNEVGTATVTCFDENDFSKNNVIKINVGF